MLQKILFYLFPTRIESYPQDKLTLEMCQYAVRRVPRLLEYVPADIQNLEPNIGLKAVERCIYNIVNVKASITCVIYKTVLKHPEIIRFLEESQEHEVNWSTVTSRNPECIKYMKPWHITSNIAKMAIEYDSKLISSVPDQYVTISIAHKHAKYLDCIPDRLKTRSLCKKAVKLNPDNIQYVPKRLKGVVL